MPSNSKQKKKAQSRLSSSSSAPESTASSETYQPQQLASLCQEASQKFPSFISESAFVGEITDVVTAPISKGSKIWLSEPSMLSSSLAPGSIVSVSIPSSNKESKQLHNFPLTSLANECVKCYGLETCKTLNDGAGNYFAIATVFPSSKVLKNGVHLSSNLSYTMGCPPLGTSVFVHPLQKQYLSSLANGNNGLHLTENNCLLFNCKELYLQLAPCTNRLPLKVNNFPSLNLPKAKSHVQCENDIISSPKTPYQSKVSNGSGLSSPDSESSVTNNSSQSMVSFDVSETLGNESSKNLLQTCTASWLDSRCLLLGNLVNVPMFSELCIFQVIGAKKVPVTIPYHYPPNGSSKKNPEDSDTEENVNLAFTVNLETKVFLSLPSNVASEEPIQKDLSCVKLNHKVANASMCDTISKLGGLSKEYTILRDIISSSVKDTLSSGRSSIFTL